MSIIAERVLGGGGMFRARAMRFVFPTTEELNPPTLSKDTAQPGDIVRISSFAFEGTGLFLSPVGDPKFLTFVRASPHPTTGKGRCLTSDFETVWAEYRVRDDAPPGTARMALALRENVGTGCNGEGIRSDEKEALLRIVPPPEPTPEPIPEPTPVTPTPEPTPAPTPAPTPEPTPPPVVAPPPEEPERLLCRLPILKQFFCPG
ncbi:hypothetical protein KAR91_61695 [Candidatus Pacearchaeota archaeon]|nr:hypothetical protein [Candidatus Pacearchaeota archaeon]